MLTSKPFYSSSTIASIESEPFVAAAKLALDSAIKTSDSSWIVADMKVGEAAASQLLIQDVRHTPSPNRVHVAFELHESSTKGVPVMVGFLFDNTREVELAPGEFESTFDALNVTVAQDDKSESADFTHVGLSVDDPSYLLEVYSDFPRLVSDLLDQFPI